MIYNKTSILGGKYISIKKDLKMKTYDSVRQYAPCRGKNCTTGI